MLTTNPNQVSLQVSIPLPVHFICLFNKDVKTLQELDQSQDIVTGNVHVSS